MINDDTAKDRIGKNVSRLLEERGWSQKTLAEKAQSTEMMISRICRGLHLPNAGIVSRIAEALGVTVDDLLRKPPGKNYRRGA